MQRYYIVSSIDYTLSIPTYNALGYIKSKGQAQQFNDIALPLEIISDDDLPILICSDIVEVEPTYLPSGEIKNAKKFIQEYVSP